MSYYLIIRGPLGSGKTTIAERLAQEMQAKHIAIDSILDEHHLTDDHEDGYISQNSFKRANEICAPEADRLLKAGTPVIFDGNFYWPSQIDDLINRLDFPHEVFTLTVPLDICIERDGSRDKPHGRDAATAVYEKTVSFSYGKLIDATDSAERIITALKRELPPRNPT